MITSIHILLIICLITSACNRVSDIDRYHKMVSSQLNSGIKKDSIFLDLKFGMSVNSFYKYCWAMNRKKLFFNSHDNNAVIYQMNNGLKFAAVFRFTPEFHKDRLYKITIDAYYAAFAPWNQHLFADSLEKDLQHLFNSWYGAANYLIVKNPMEGDSLIKIDGNRQIRIKKISEKDIRIEYTDLFIEKSLHANPSSS
ncbi:MAG: hypothetical protein H7122_17175 [Chitinophagaceae bacterium]|nr:hypothetical protein [Chitinophagaceae bacterium]